VGDGNAIERQSRHGWTPALALAGILVVAFVLRLVIGLQLPLDADEAVEAIGGLRLLHGELLLMEPDGRYLGALDCYFIAPFLAVLGPTLLAVRAAMSLVGALYVAAMWWLGRLLFRSPRGGLLLAAVAAVFPLFAVDYAVKARAYGSLLLLEALLLALSVRVVWPNREPRRRDWLAAGLAAGLAVWQHPLLALPVGLCLMAGLLRARAWRSLLPAVAGGLIGFTPWLVYNGVITHLGSIRHLYSPLQAYSVPTHVAAGQVITEALPIFVGVRMNFCGAETVPWPVADLGLLGLAAAALWIRRTALAGLLHGRLEPVDLVLLLAPLSVLAVTLRWFNGLSCEPRYLMPLAVPLAVAAALILRLAPPRRWAAGLAAAAWLAIAAVTTVHTVQQSRDLVVIPGVLARVDVATAGRALAGTPPEALWAQYWLARPLQFYSGDSFVVGEYGGYVGFRATQQAAYAARHPSWLFLAGDREAAALEAICARRGITYQRSEPAPGLVLYSDLSQPLTPDDLHLGGQRVDHTDPDPTRIRPW